MLGNIIRYLLNRRTRKCITENKDLDREVFNCLRDEDVIMMWNINRRIYFDVFDDAYLRRRLSKYSDIEKYKEKDETWKRFFVRSTHSIARLNKKYNFGYTSGNFNDYYDILKRQLVAWIPVIACQRGDFPLILFCLKNISLTYMKDAIYEALKHGHLNIVKYLIKNGTEFPAFRHLESLEFAASNFDTLKYLVEVLHFDFHKGKEVVLRRASASGHLDIVKYVVERGANVNINQGSPLRSAALEGHYEIVKYLVEKGSIISPKAYEFAKKHRHYHIADYLDKHFVYKKLEL